MTLQSCEKKPALPLAATRLDSLLAHHQAELTSLHQHSAVLTQGIDSLFVMLDLAEQELAWQDSMTQKGPWKQPKWREIRTKTF